MQRSSNLSFASLRVSHHRLSNVVKLEIMKVEVARLFRSTLQLTKEAEGIRRHSLPAFLGKASFFVNRSWGVAHRKARQRPEFRRRAFSSPQVRDVRPRLRRGLRPLLPNARSSRRSDEISPSTSRTSLCTMGGVNSRRFFSEHEQVRAAPPSHIDRVVLA